MKLCSDGVLDRGQLQVFQRPGWFRWSANFQTRAAGCWGSICIGNKIKKEEIRGLTHTYGRVQRQNDTNMDHDRIMYSDISTVSTVESKHT